MQLPDAMVDYMTELNCGIPEDIIRGKLADFIDSQWEAGIIRIDLAIEKEICIGFSVYQIDTSESDWCKRPGWGFIREFYVMPAFRSHGTGKILALHTQQALYKMGAKQLYLTSDDAVPFWQHCGWQLTEELCSNGQYILEK
jgi:GNAT superfamily N-acetyltransferase